MKATPAESLVLRHLSILLIALLTVAYPLAMYFVLDHVEPGWMATPLVVLALGRAWLSRDRVWLAIAAGVAMLGLVGQLREDVLPLQLYPVLVNIVLLGVFGYSLLKPPSAIERLASIRNPVLPPEAVAYTRAVTKVWCGFFILNGSMALATALWASHRIWALYNGLIAYGLIGLLFGVEWLVRRRVQARALASAQIGATRV